MTTVKPKKAAKKTSAPAGRATKPGKTAKSGKPASAAKPAALPRWLAKPTEAVGKQLKKLEGSLAKGALSERIDALRDLARPAVDLVVKRVKPEEIEGVMSRMGGDPDLPASLPWPRVNGDSLTFVAQVLVDDVKPLDGEGLLPKTGLLSFFVQLDAEAPDYGGQCFVAHFPVTTDLSRILPPTSAASTATNVGLLTMKERLALPALDSAQVAKLALSPKEQKAYRELLEESEPQKQRHMLLGWPTAATKPGNKGKRFIAQFDTDERLSFVIGKKATLRFFVDGEKLDAKTLTTAACTIAGA